MNALAAAAAAGAGAGLEHISGRPCERARGPRDGCSSSAPQGGAWLIDDSYNANPSSVRAAIEVLAQLDGRKWLVLGDMAELGSFANSSHAEIGALRARAGSSGCLRPAP
jgi:UDP-N-acetylmuramyl pentapeptide synthase